MNSTPGSTPNTLRRQLMKIASAAAILAVTATLTLASPALADDTGTPAPDPTASTAPTTPTDGSSTAPDPTASVAPVAPAPSAPVTAPDPTTSPDPTTTPAPTTTPDPTTTPAPTTTPDPTTTPNPTTTPDPTATPDPTSTSPVSPQSFVAAVTPAAPAVKPSPVVVSLTFDDGNADTVSAAPIMAASGMHGTYYTNSGTIGLPGYQTRADLSSLYAAGNEIGGHTVNHPDLTTLPISEVQRQICLDRNNLLSWGFQPQSFAYPFADTNNAIDAVAQSCGYNSARNLGDIQSRFGCSGCEYAETIPPAKPYELAALDEADDTWTLADLESTVTNAQTHGGGWVILTFHHICDGNCDPLAVTPELFAQFTQWLATQSANGTTVKTVGQVIGGTTKPAVTVPPVTSSATVTNPSLETLIAGTNLPSCWTEAGYGTNTATWSTVTPGHTGNIAAKLVVTGYTDGDAKVMPSLDLGTCSPSVIPGNSYQLGAYYETAQDTQFEVYLRTTSGAWVYWDSSPYFGPSSTWTQATWNTQPIPAGYDGIDFGLTLFSNGTLTTDDYSLAPAVTPLVTTATTVPAAPDGNQGWYKTAPVVTLSASNTGSAATTVYSLDGGATWNPYTTPVTIPNNRTVFEYKSSTATQTEAAHTINFAVDTDLPTVIAAFDANRTYSAFGSDATSGPSVIQFSKDGGLTWNTYPGPTATDNGSLALQFRAIDVAGNVSPVVSISEPAITTAVVSPASPDGLAGWYNTHPTVTLTAGTPSADQVTQYAYNGGAWNTYTAPVVVPDGTWAFSYRTTGSGTTEATQTLFSLLSVDTTPPVVLPEYGATTHSYSATATDAGSGVVSIEESINGGPWIQYPGPTTTTASQALEFRATDSAGNVSAIVPLSVGTPAAVTTAAVTPATPNGLAGWYTTAPQVQLSASGTVAGAETEYSFGGVTWTPYTGVITIPAGLSTLSYRTISGGTTENTQTLSFKVDLDAPTVIPAFNSTTRTWSATATDATSTVGGIRVRIPGGAWTAYSGPVAIGNASLSLEFQATDVAGNVSTVVPLKEGAITSSSVVPSAPNGAAGWYTTAPVVTLSTGASSLGSPSSDQVTSYSFDGINWNTYTAPFTVPQGTTTLSFRTSGAGFTEATHTLAFKVDTIAPVVTPAFNTTTRTYSVTATDATSGVALTQVSVNGGAWTTYAGPTAVGTGSISLQFRATDVAGNTSAAVSLTPGATVTAAISPTAPNGANGWYSTAPTVTLTSGTLASGETLQYSFNGTTWSTYSTPVALPTGVDVIQYRSSSASAASGSLTAKVDLVNPTVVASFKSTTRTVTVTSADVGSGVASTLWRVGTTGSWTAYTGPFTVSTAAESLQFESTDVSGRVSTVTSLSIPAGVTIASSTVTLTIDPAKVPYLRAGTARVSVTAGGKAALGNVAVTVDGKAYKTVMLFGGKATVQLSRTLAVGSHAVVAQYLGSATSLAATSATATLTVSKATTIVILSKVVSTTLASKVTGTHSKKAASHVVQVKVNIKGSSKKASGKIELLVNGKKVRTVSLTAAHSGALVLALPKLHKTKSGKVTVQAKFLGTKNLKSAKSKKMVLHLS